MSYQFIPGVGGKASNLCIVAGSPHEENEVFIEKVAKFLGLELNNIYRTNVIKLNIPEETKLSDEEIISWKPLLEKEIYDVQPHIVLALGACAAQSILLSKEKIGVLRGKDYRIHWFQHSFYVVPTWHPLYLSKQPNNEEIRNQLKFDLNIVKHLLKNV